MLIRKIARTYVSITDQISRIAGITALFFLLAMIALTVSDVTLRFVFNAPINGSLEMTEFMMVVAGFLGIAWCASKRMHVKLDMIVNHFPPRVQGIIDGFTILLGMAVVFLVSWQNFIQANHAQIVHAASDALSIPEYPFYAIVGISYALLFLELITVLVENIAKAVKK